MGECTLISFSPPRFLHGGTRYFCVHNAIRVAVRNIGSNRKLKR